MSFKSSKMPYTISHFHIPGFWRLEDSERRIAAFYVFLGLKAVKWPEREMDQGRVSRNGLWWEGCCTRQGNLLTGGNLQKLPRRCKEPDTGFEAEQNAWRRTWGWDISWGYTFSSGLWLKQDKYIPMTNHQVPLEINVNSVSDLY